MVGRVCVLGLVAEVDCVVRRVHAGKAAERGISRFFLASQPPQRQPEECPAMIGQAVEELSRQITEAT